MKKLMAVFVFCFILVFTSSIFIGCGDEDVILNNNVITANGVFILYEGVFGQSNSYDYGFIDLNTGNVNSNIYRSVNGNNLNAFPDGMVLHLNSDLYICSQGNYSGPGSIYKINSTNNQLISSRVSFGRNPYNFVIHNNRIYVSNIAGDFITVMNLDFSSVNDSLAVGSNPSDIIYALDNIYISKASYTTENSVAVINTITNSVSKVYFTAPPVSVANNIGGIYVSTYSNKKLYVLDSSSAQVIDSIALTINEPAIGTIIAGSPRTLYILGVSDTSFAGNIGKKVYKYDILNRSVDPNFNVEFTGNNDVYGITYEPFERRIYISNSKSGQQNAELLVYDENGALLRTYPDVGGKLSKRIAIKY